MIVSSSRVHKRNGQSFCGNNMVVDDDGCTVIGNNNTVNGDGCTVVGKNNTINGDGCTVTGTRNKVLGDGCTVTGTGNTVSGKGSRTIGSGNITTSPSSSSSSSYSQSDDGGTTLQMGNSTFHFGSLSGVSVIGTNHNVVRVNHSPAQAKYQAPPDPYATIRDLVPEEAPDDSDRTCCVCLTNIANVSYQCGHIHCPACAIKLEKCPQCDQPVTSCIRLYI